MSSYRNWAQGVRYGLSTITLASVILLSTHGIYPVRGETTSYPVAASIETSNTPLRNQVIFASDIEGNFRIYELSLDSRTIRRLVKNDKSNFNPTVSRDGRIAFSRAASLDDIDIIMLDEYGEEKILEDSGKNLTHTQSWSPDGKKIAFSSYGEDGIPRIYIMNSNGSNSMRLTEGPDLWPAWSPDGKKIAYIRFPEEKTSGIGTLRIRYLERNKDIQVTDRHYFATPSWRGDREILASQAQAGAPGCISAIDIITKVITPITFPYDKNGTPPDPHDCFHDLWPISLGEIIIFTGWEGIKYQLFKINRDGTGLERLTSQGNNITPSVVTEDVVGQSLGLEEHLFTEKSGILVPSYPGFTHGHLNEHNRLVPLSVPSRVVQEEHWNFVNRRLSQVPR